MFDIGSDFLFAANIHGHRLRLWVLVIALLGVALQVIKWLVLRRTFMRRQDDWVQIRAMIMVGYFILIFEDIPQIYLLFQITNDKKWDFFSELSFGISILSCIWKLSQDILLKLECLVIDETGTRLTSAEKVASFVREASMNLAPSIFGVNIIESDIDKSHEVVEIPHQVSVKLLSLEMKLQDLKRSLSIERSISCEQSLSREQSSAEHDEHNYRQNSRRDALVPIARNAFRFGVQEMS